MPKSTSMLADVTSVVTNGPNAATQALAIAAGGPIMDYTGNVRNVRRMIEEALVVLGGSTLKGIKAVLDGADPNLTLVNGLIALINGTGGPSTAALADLGTAITNGATAASAALAIAAGGPIMDIVGNLRLVQTKLNSAKVLLGGTTLKGIKDVTDSTDSTNLTLVNNLILVLV
jgi:hypothetical protein